MNLAAKTPQHNPGTIPPKTLFFLRHAESTYNAGGLDKHIPLLNRSYRDAPLTPGGAIEAKTWADRLRQVLREGEGTASSQAVASLLDAECVFSSPLTRALQTALVALAPLFERRPDLRIVLEPDLREQVDAFHWDAVGELHSDAIKERAVEALGAVEGLPPEVVQEASRVKVDASLTEGQWWSQDAESNAENEQRVTSFLQGFWGGGCKAAVIVGHSGTFRHAFRTAWDAGVVSYIPAWFGGTTDDWLVELETTSRATLPRTDLTHRKMPNLGLASMYLECPDPDPASKPVIRRVRLLLGTFIEGSPASRFQNT